MGKLRVARIFLECAHCALRLWRVSLHNGVNQFYEVLFTNLQFPFFHSKILDLRFQEVQLHYVIFEICKLFGNLGYQLDYGRFHLHLLVFPFIYQFNSRIGILVNSSFANDYFKRISTTFQHHFRIFLLWFLHEKECSFYITGIEAEPILLGTTNYQINGFFEAKFVS